MLYTNEGAPYATGKAVTLNLGQPSTMFGQPWVRSNRPQPRLGGWWVGPSCNCGWASLYPKSVMPVSGPFDPCEPDSHIMIGRHHLPWIEECFSCSWSVVSPLIYLHTNIYQHLWKWSVINPYHYVDIHLLCIYEGFDGLNLVLKRHQQHPHT